MAITYFWAKEKKDEKKKYTKFTSGHQIISTVLVRTLNANSFVCRACSSSVFFVFVSVGKQHWTNIYDDTFAPNFYRINWMLKRKEKKIGIVFVSISISSSHRFDGNEYLVELRTFVLLIEHQWFSKCWWFSGVNLLLPRPIKTTLRAFIQLFLPISFEFALAVYIFTFHSFPSLWSMQ